MKIRTGGSGFYGSDETKTHYPSRPGTQHTAVQPRVSQNTNQLHQPLSDTLHQQTTKHSAKDVTLTSAPKNSGSLQEINRASNGLVEALLRHRTSGGGIHKTANIDLASANSDPHGLAQIHLIKSRVNAIFEGKLLLPPKVFIARNYEQFQQLCQNVTMGQRGIELCNGPLIEAATVAKQPTVLIIDEKGFSQTELESFNELKQNGILEGTKVPIKPLVVSLVDTQAQSNGVRSAALVSRATYCPVEFESTPPLPQLSPETTLNADNTTIIDCFNDPQLWKTGLQKAVQYLESGIQLTNPLSPIESASSSAPQVLVLRDPPLNTPEFLDHLQNMQTRWRDKPIEIRLEQGLSPETFVAQHQIQAQPGTAEQQSNALAVHSDNIEHILSEVTIKLHDPTSLVSTTACGPGLLRDPGQPITLFITSPLSPAQWKKLLLSPRPKQLLIASGVAIPTAYKQFTTEVPRQTQTKPSSEADLYQQCLEGQLAPGAYTMTHGQAAQAIATTKGTSIYVTPQMQLNDLFQQLQNHTHSNAQSTSMQPAENQLQLSARLIQGAQDLIQGKTLFIHHLDCNPRLRQQLHSMAASHQLTLPGRCLHWPNSTPNVPGATELKGAMVLIDKPIAGVGHIDVPDQAPLLPGTITPPSTNQQTPMSRSIPRKIDLVNVINAAEALESHRGVFLQGPAGAGKTYAALEAARHLKLNVTRAKVGDLGQPAFSEAVAQWAQPVSPEHSGHLLFIDEANLAAQGSYNLLEEALTSNSILINGERVTLSPTHKICFTGNDHHLPGRVEHGVVKSLFKTTEIKQQHVDQLQRLFIQSPLEKLREVSPINKNLMNSKKGKANAKTMARLHASLAQHLGEKINGRTLRDLTVAMALSPDRSFHSALRHHLIRLYASDLNADQKKLFTQWLNLALPEQSKTSPQTPTPEPRVNWPENATITPTASTEQLARLIDTWIHEQSALSQTEPRLGNRALLLEGPAGRGKDAVVEARLDLAGKHYTHINASTNIEAISRAINAAKNKGEVLWISELNLLPSSVTESELNGLLNNDEPSAPGFCLIATINPEKDYAGRHQLSAALKSRMHCISIDDYPPSEQQQIVGQTVGDPVATKMLMKKHSQLINQLSQQPELIKPTTRELLKAAQMIRQNLGNESQHRAQREQTVAAVFDKVFGYYQDQLIHFNGINQASVVDHNLTTGLKTLLATAQNQHQSNNTNPKPTIREKLHHARRQLSKIQQSTSQHVKARLQQLTSSLHRASQSFLSHDSVSLKSDHISSQFNSPLTPTKEQVKRAEQAFKEMLYSNPIGMTHADHPDDQNLLLRTHILTNEGNKWSATKSAPVGQLATGIAGQRVDIQYSVEMDIIRKQVHHNLLLPVGTKPINCQIQHQHDRCSSITPRLNETNGQWSVTLPRDAKSIQFSVIPVELTAAIPLNTPAPTVKNTLDLGVYPEFATQINQLKQAFFSQSIDIETVANRIKDWINQPDSDFIYSLDYDQITNALPLHVNAQDMLRRRNGCCRDYAQLAARILTQEFGVATRQVIGYQSQKNGDQSNIGLRQHQWVEYFDPKTQIWHQLDATSAKLKPGLHIPQTQRSSTSANPLSFSPTELLYNFYFNNWVDTQLLSSRELLLQVNKAKQNILQNHLNHTFNADGHGQLDMTRLLNGHTDCFRQVNLSNQNARIVFDQATQDVLSSRELGYRNTKIIHDTANNSLSTDTPSIQLNPEEAVTYLDDLKLALTPTLSQVMKATLDANAIETPELLSQYEQLSHPQRQQFCDALASISMNGRSVNFSRHTTPHAALFQECLNEVSSLLPNYNKIYHQVEQGHYPTSIALESAQKTQFKSLRQLENMVSIYCQYLKDAIQPSDIYTSNLPQEVKDAYMTHMSNFLRDVATGKHSVDKASVDKRLKHYKALLQPFEAANTKFHFNNYKDHLEKFIALSLLSSNPVAELDFIQQLITNAPGHKVIGDVYHFRQSIEVLKSRVYDILIPQSETPSQKDDIEPRSPEVPFLP